MFSNKLRDSDPSSSFQMLSSLYLLFLLSPVPSLLKTTYCKIEFPNGHRFKSFVLLVNLENTYGPYCNADNVYAPDAGLVRYAGTPWTGRCELNLRSCCLPSLTNSSLVSNTTFATRFYIYLIKPPTCLTETVAIESTSGDTVDRFN